MRNHGDDREADEARDEEAVEFLGFRFGQP
jgi:hypothetical protein